MESFLHADDDEIRISNPPRRSPQITKALTSPVRSVHPQLQGMDSINSQADFGLRTADFFEDSSGEESVTGIDPDSVAPDIDQLDRRGSTNRKRRTASTVEPLVSQCESKSGTVDPSSAGYHRLTPSATIENDELQGGLFDKPIQGGLFDKPIQGGLFDKPTAGELNRFPPVFGVPTYEDNRLRNTTFRGSTYEVSRLPETASSFHGSVDELLPNNHGNTPPQQNHAPRLPNGRTPRASAYVEQPENRQSAAPSTKIDQTLGAYAIAHEITLHALLRDEEALDRSLQAIALAPLPPGDRNSLLPQSLDPRSPRTRRYSSAPPAKKAVHLVPPPIDTSAPRHSLPADLIRTPYPFPPSSERHIHFSQSSSPPPTAATATSSTESILTLSIRRSNPNSKLRLTSLTIPASNDYTAVRGSSLGAKERHFRALDFDDAQFFLEIRRCYRELSGSLRFFSARSLKRIAVSGPATKAADLGYGWRSPRILAYKGLNDTFSEEQILRHYRKPELGKSRYAFVQWAHRLTAATPARPPHADDSTFEHGLFGQPERLEFSQPEGLEFVVAWSVRRILAALTLVFVLSIAAVLLWTFLGKQTPGLVPSHGGFRDAGDRLATGFLMGICVLVTGLSGIAGWLGVSWLVM